MTWPKCFFFRWSQYGYGEVEREVVWGGGRKTVPHVQIKLAEVLSREHLQQIQDMLWVVCWYRVSGFWSNR